MSALAYKERNLINRGKVIFVFSVEKYFCKKNDFFLILN
jgi:hypothetical protein